MKKNTGVCADTHLTGLSISVFEDLYLWYIATEYERTWKQNERTLMQNERNVRGHECKMNGDERKWKQKMTSVDFRPRMLSHPQKAGKITLLVYRELTTWEHDKSKKKKRQRDFGSFQKIPGFYATPRGSNSVPARVSCKSHLQVGPPRVCDSVPRVSHSSAQQAHRTAVSCKHVWPETPPKTDIVCLRWMPAAVFARSFVLQLLFCLVASCFLASLLLLVLLSSLFPPSHPSLF